MATSRVSLSKSEYVRVNFGLNPITIEAAEGVVHVAVTNYQPSLNNKAFHRVKDWERLHIQQPDANVWVLAVSGVQKCVVTEQNNTRSMITDRQERSAKISQKGELLTGGNVDDVDVNFQYTNRTAEIEIVETGTGTVSHPGASGAYAQLSPGTGVGLAQITSKAPVRYRGGHEVYSEMSMIFRAPEANLNQFVGFLNSSDRLGFGYQGANFGIFYREGGNETFVAQADFNVDPIDGSGPSGYTINPLAINVYRAAYVWHGGLPLTLEIQVGQQWWPVHVFDFSNSITETHLENPHLPIGAEVERTSGTGTDDEARTASWRGGSIASAVDEPSDDWTSWTTLDVSLSNARVNIQTFYNPTTWQGKENHIVYELGVIAFSNGGNKDVAVYGTKGATQVGFGAFASIDVNNYALQVAEGGTITGGTRGAATILKSGGERRTDVQGTGIKIYPGEYFTIEVDAGGPVNGTFSCSSRLIHEG